MRCDKDMNVKNFRKHYLKGAKPPAELSLSHIFIDNNV